VDILGGTKGFVSNKDKEEGLKGVEDVDEGVFVDFTGTSLMCLSSSLTERFK